MYLGSVLLLSYLNISHHECKHRNRAKGKNDFTIMCTEGDLTGALDDLVARIAAHKCSVQDYIYVGQG